MTWEGLNLDTPTQDPSTLLGSSFDRWSRLSSEHCYGWKDRWYKLDSCNRYFNGFDQHFFDEFMHWNLKCVGDSSFLLFCSRGLWECWTNSLKKPCSSMGAHDSYWNHANICWNMASVFGYRFKSGWILLEISEDFDARIFHGLHLWSILLLLYCNRDVICTYDDLTCFITCSYNCMLYFRVTPWHRRRSLGYEFNNHHAYDRTSPLR